MGLQQLPHELLARVADGMRYRAFLPSCRVARGKITDTFLQPTSQRDLASFGLVSKRLHVAGLGDRCFHATLLFNTNQARRSRMA